MDMASCLDANSSFEAEHSSASSESRAAAAETSPTSQQRARAERNRLRARELRDQRRARLRPDPPPQKLNGVSSGGFIPESKEPEPVKRAAPRLAPVLDPMERPHCEHCGMPFEHSHLLETFDFAACDGCRDDEGPHSLLTRTEAKTEYLLQDCDLDLRPPPLRCLRRRNPHSARGDMRLYLRAQVEQRALLVWGSEAALEAEAERREEARLRSKQRRGAKRMRALRFDVRSALFRNTHHKHEHRFGDERYDADTDLYEHVCIECGNRETYEKM